MNGTNQYIDTSINTTPNSVSIELICSIASNTSTKVGGNTVAQYITFRQNSRTSGFEGVVLNYIQSGSTGYFSANMSSSGGINKAANTSLINFNQVYFITGVYNSTNVSIYMNGQFVSQTSTGFPIDYHPTHTYKIGRASGIGQSFDGYMNGTLYNMRIYNQSLSATEILQNYNALKNRFI